MTTAKAKASGEISSDSDMSRLPKHTATPWIAHDVRDRVNAEGPFIGPHDCKPVCCLTGYYSAEQTEANASLIVSAVNSHASLIAALQAARERMMGSSPAIRALIAQTDAALAVAKG